MAAVCLIGGFIIDLKCNQKLDGGWSKCHLSRDLLLTPTGDLALTEDGRDNMLQKLALWVVTPKGELTDPRAGCSLYTGRHSKNTGESLAFLSGDLLADLRYSFPEWMVRRVRCYSTYNENGKIANNACACAIELAEETIDLFLPTEIPEEVWLGAKSFLRYGKLNARMEG